MDARKLGRWCGRLLSLGVVLWLATLAAITVHVLRAESATASLDPADAIICLGAGVTPVSDDLDFARAVPTDMIADSASYRRAVACAGLQKAGVAPVIVFTGSGNAVGSAAAAMARIALNLGVPDTAIMVEEEARSTIQNAAFSMAMLPPDLSRIVVVSDAFHLPRAAVIFRILGPAEVQTSVADPQGAGEDHGGLPMWRWIVREASAIWSNIARGLAFGAGGLVGIDADTRIGWFN